MAKAGTLSVAVTANTSQFDRAIIAAQGKIKRFGKSFSGMFAGVAAGLSAGALIGATKQLINNMDRIDERAGIVGISAERYQQLAYAAKMTGAEMGMVENAMFRATRQLGEANNGNKMAADAFRSLGLETQRLTSLSPDQLLDAIVTALKEMPDEAEKARIGVALLGRSGQQLNEFMAKYIELGVEAKNNGFIIQDSEVKAAAKINDAIDRLTLNLTALVSNTGFASWLGNIADTFWEILQASKMINAEVERNGVRGDTSVSTWREVGREAVRILYKINPAARAQAEATAYFTGRTPEEELERMAVGMMQMLGDDIVTDGEVYRFFAPSANAINTARIQRLSRQEERAELLRRADRRTTYAAEKAAEEKEKIAAEKLAKKAQKKVAVTTPGNTGDAGFSLAALARGVLGVNSPQEKMAKSVDNITKSTNELVLLARQSNNRQAEENLSYL